MRRVTLRWLVAGAVLGALAFFTLMLCISALLSGVEFRHWHWIVAVLCPPAIVLRGFWLLLGLNCALYAVVLAALRYAWIRLRG